ncbi:hypothetical protein [Deinococcus cellulosilyticus]|uniref:Lipoprotein n=1 Tax=Deinococcus cellulosilyticus (strain DSM 18568 / NBRC 106333 / KACC 11606 / 5516J-15) TaxID=1223518 RepID=A0A511N4I6_DEIC1|nr:hypothetical protein [Deinococcus cellulosilyticus]GEM47387.1 hypothetical protein DC3_30220 [Deinococcus cellulosilyticus NBRC 106333 = KACC 11606]
MRRSAFLLLLVLTGCTRNSDGITPQIILQEPSSGAITRAGKALVKGYAFDEAGVQSIKINDTELFTVKGYASKKGKRIVPFSFQTDGKTSVSSYVIQVSDSSNNKTRLELPIRVDQKAPQITIKRVDRDLNTMRIEGVVKDNVKVQDVLVGGVSIGVTAGAEVPFYAEVPPQDTTVSAIDSAGNKTLERVETPPPPRIEPAQTTSTDTAQQ